MTEVNLFRMFLESLEQTDAQRGDSLACPVGTFYLYLSRDGLCAPSLSL